MLELGRYEILARLGQGSMGVVYKARDPLIERILAIKTVALQGLSADEADAYEQRFYREARSAGRLNHPNIVTIHDVGRSDGLAYIAMEFLEGRSLREILDSGVVLSPGKAVRIAYQVAKGLAYAHQNGVVHRDIKPANIMVLRNGTVKITDFGIALLPCGSLTLVGTALGSPKYMSPEQVLGRSVDGRSDIFSLGALLYEMLTGVAPFRAEDLQAILYQVLNETPPSPSRHNPDIPEVLDGIVAKAMAKPPGERYQDAADVARDLRGCRAMASGRSLPVSARRDAVDRATGGETVKFEITPSPNVGSGAHRAGGRSTVFWERRNVLLYGGMLALAAVAVGWAGSRQAADDTTRAAGRHVAPVHSVAREAPAAPVPAGSPIIAQQQTAPPGAAVVAPPAPAVRADAQAAGRKPPPPRRGEAVRAGTLALAIKPWGEVYVDGKSRGVTPPVKQLKLPPGKHEIEIRNADLPPYKESVVIVAGASARIRHEFK